MLTIFGENVIQWLKQIGFSAGTATQLWNMTDFLLVLISSVVIYYIAKLIIVRVFKRIAERTENVWDDILLENRVFHRMAFLIPGLLVYILAPETLNEFGSKTVHVVHTLTSIYIISIFMFIIHSFLKAVDGIYQTLEVSKYRPIKPYLQVVSIIVYIIGGILILAYVLDEKPASFLAGLGAASAILMFVFKDAILGLIGGIQLSANDMVRPGDWISMAKYGADGTIIEITLTTVKIRNGDFTITTIPTYALVSDSFQNYRGMTESDGRRIKRSVLINMNSVKFCNKELLEKFSKIQLISDYVVKKEAELAEFNAENSQDTSALINGRRQTNLGIFRAYLEAYLRSSQELNQSMSLLVRQLQPTELGIPIEIYAFSKIKEWTEYERIQADLFDHILAIIPEFDLQVFQRPSGNDIKN
jgi:miniconductance mechanosensitive channel